MKKVESLLIIGGGFLGSKLAIGLASRGRSCKLSAVTKATSAVTMRTSAVSIAISYVTMSTSAVTMATRAPHLGIVLYCQFDSCSQKFSSHGDCQGHMLSSCTIAAVVV